MFAKVGNVEDIKELIVITSIEITPQKDAYLSLGQGKAFTHLRLRE
jgi:hypothetical protein